MMLRWFWLLYGTAFSTDFCLPNVLLNINVTKDHNIISKDKDKDAFIGPKEFVSQLMMIQTNDKLFHQLK